jgi:hypothetical protein
MVVTGRVSAVRVVCRIVRVYISWFGCGLRSLVCNVDDHEVKRPKFQIFLASVADDVAFHGHFGLYFRFRGDLLSKNQKSAPHVQMTKSSHHHHHPQ